MNYSKMENINYLYENIEEIIEKGEELEVIRGCDFEPIINPNGTLSLIDKQDANLGGICEEEFIDYKDVLYRLHGSYLMDYEYVEGQTI